MAIKKSITKKHFFSSTTMNLFTAGATLMALTLTLVSQYFFLERIRHYKHPVVDPSGGFQALIPEYTITLLEGTGLAFMAVAALTMIILAFRDELNEAVNAGFCFTIALVLIATFIAPMFIIHEATRGGVQTAFDQWSSDRYGLDTSLLSEKQHRNLMEYSKRPVELPTGEWIQSINLDRTKYLIFALGNEIPVIAHYHK